LGVLRGKKQVIGGVFLERYGLGMLVLREREREMLRLPCSFI